MQPGDRLGGELHPLTDGLDRLGTLLVRGRVVAEDGELEARSAQRVPQIVRDRRGQLAEDAEPLAMQHRLARAGELLVAPGMVGDVFGDHQGDRLAQLQVALEMEGDQCVGCRVPISRIERWLALDDDLIGVCQHERAQIGICRGGARGLDGKQWALQQTGKLDETRIGQLYAIVAHQRERAGGDAAIQGPDPVRGEILGRPVLDPLHQLRILARELRVLRPEQLDRELSVGCACHCCCRCWPSARRPRPRGSPVWSRPRR